MKWLEIFTVTLMACVLPIALLAQTADYNKVIAQARADLAAGHNTEVLVGSQKAIQMDPSRWEAYLVAGSALQSQKQFDPAMDKYTKALERAPESKKAGVRNVLEQCMREKISAASSPAIAAQAIVQAPAPDVLYNNALRDYNGGKNDLSVQELNDYIKFYPNADLAGNAHFYLAEIQFSAADYPNAVTNYDFVLKNFASGNKAAAAQLKKGFALLELGKEDAAKQELQHVIQRYPKTKEATQARERLREVGTAVAPSGRPEVPAGSTPAATAEGATFRETLDWLISKNAQEGYTYTTVSYFPNGGHTDPDTGQEQSPFGPSPDGVQCTAAIGRSTINFSKSTPNSVAVQSFDVHKIWGMTSADGTVTRVTSAQDTYFVITGMWQGASFDQSLYLGPVYSDQALANRVAKALNHAVDVCGSKGKPEAF